MSYEDNKKSGFITIHRSLLNWEWYSDINTTRMFIHCLLKANHRDKKHKGQMIKRGSFLTSVEMLSNECNLTPKKVRTALEHLKKTNELAIETSPKGSIVSIKNYDLYQTMANVSSNKGQTNGKQRATNNNENNENNGGGTPFTTDFLEFWKSYSKHGFKDDCFKFWTEQEYNQETIKAIIYGAKMFSKENSHDIKHMLYPRTFLQDEKWKDYSLEKNSANDETPSMSLEQELMYFHEMGMTREELLEKGNSAEKLDELGIYE